MRLPRSERRDQIVDAALELLAEAPVEELTTRALARRVGLTQPGLFRHFLSRDAILLAVLERIRGYLAAAASSALSTGGLEGARALTAGLGSEVKANPGLLRLLVHAMHRGKDPLRAKVASLVDGQVNLVAHLVRTEAPDVDERAAGVALVALVQGTLLQWQLMGRPEGLDEQLEAAVALWLGGVRAGQPPRPQRSTPRARVPLQTLDVRPLLEAGQDPLASVLEAVEGMAEGGVLHLIAPFRPTPLLTLLRSQGHHVDCTEEDGLFEVLVSAGPVLDLRDLEAPEPMAQLLERSAGLAAGASLAARTPRPPRLLLPRLEGRGVQVQILEVQDGSALVFMRVEP